MGLINVPKQVRIENVCQVKLQAFSYKLQVND